MPDSQPHYAVIVRPDTDKFVLVPQGDKWMLPTCPRSYLTDIIRSIKDQFGLTTIMLDFIHKGQLDGDPPTQYYILLLEDHSTNPDNLSDGQWVSVHELGAYAFTNPEHQNILERWFIQRETSKESQPQIPWFQSGWFDKASNWIYEQIARTGLVTTKSIEQLYFRIWSCILRISTDQGDIYFKATLPSCGYEAVLTQTLYRLWPNNMPEVIACERDQFWLLMRDSGKNLESIIETEDAPNLVYYEEALATYARVQHESRQYLDKLQATGYPDYSLARLPDLYEELLHDTKALAVGESHGLSREEYEQLRLFSPHVHEICNELHSLGIPETLHHDDLWCGNMTQKNENYIFFDWAESAYGHPFCSLYTLLKHAKHMLNYDEAMRDRLRDSYLTHWVNYAPLEKLIEGFTTAQRLALLCRALTWHRMFKGVPEKVRGDYASEVPSYVKNFMLGNVWD